MKRRKKYESYCQADSMQKKACSGCSGAGKGRCLQCKRGLHSDRYETYASQCKAIKRFHGTDAASIGYLYDWYDAIPEMLETKEALKQRILKTNGVHRKDDEK